MPQQAHKRRRILHMLVTNQCISVYICLILLGFRRGKKKVREGDEGEGGLTCVLRSPPTGVTSMKGRGERSSASSSGLSPPRSRHCTTRFSGRYAAGPLPPTCHRLLLNIFVHDFFGVETTRTTTADRAEARLKTRLHCSQHNLSSSNLISRHESRHAHASASTYLTNLI